MSHDVVVIGGGSGGVRFGRIAASLGAKVALVESDRLGGTCVNVGCVPKKLFARAALYSEDLEDARGFGWTVDGVQFDWQTLMRNKDTEIARLNGIYQRILEAPGVEIVRGRGVVTGPNTVQVGERTLEAPYLVIATGARAWWPEIRGVELGMTSDDLFELDTLPARMTVLGGGYIACEFASILNGLGVETSLCYRGSLFLRHFDQELRMALAEEMRKKGIALHFDWPLEGLERAGDQLQVVAADGRRIDTDAVLLALGRRANTEGLGLEEVGVALSPTGGVVVDERFTSSVPSILAVGDVIERAQLTPVALAQGMILARRLFGERDDRMDYANIPTTVFCHPNLATVGLTEEEATERLPQGRVFVSRFRPMKHTLSGRPQQTVMKLLVDGASDRVVGAHVLGPDAGEIIQGVAVAVRMGATKADFDRTIGIHPTSAEELVTMRTAARSWGSPS